MGIFTDFVSEKNAEINPFVLFSQLSAQEGDDICSIAAYFYRMHYFPHRCQDGVDMPSYPSFSFYKFNVCDGFFIPNHEFDDSFQENCLLMLRGVGEGHELDDEPDSQGLYYFDRMYGYNLPQYLQSRSFEMFSFHKKEIIEFLTSQDINLPECLLPPSPLSNSFEKEEGALTLQSMNSTLEVAFVNGQCGYEEALSPLEEENEKLKKEILFLKEEISLINQNKNSQYEHHSEGLLYIQDAIKELWSTYDEDEPQTAPTKGEVLEYLDKRGVGKNMAEAVNLILRPMSLQGIGKRPKKSNR